MRVRGFRSLHDVEWHPGDLNVVIGPNGSGKSNLLRVLELLSNSAAGRLGKYVSQAGGFWPLLWDGQVTGLWFGLETSAREEGESQARHGLTYELELQRLGFTSGYRIVRELLSSCPWDERGEPLETLKYLERSPSHSVLFDEREGARTATEESVDPNESLLSLVSSPFTTKSARIADYQAGLEGWRIYQDFQTHPEAPVRRAPISRRELEMAPDGRNLVSFLHTHYTSNREFKRSIDDAMRVAFDEEFEELVFPPDADQRIQLRVRWRSLKREQSVADLSDGTLRFLFLIAVLADPQPPPLIAIDEPETGLHPSMFPIVGDHALEAARHTQISLTTHCADVLDAFDEEIPTTTVVHWEEGKTRLQVVSQEELEYWLRRYTLGKLYRTGELEGMD